MQAKRDKRTRTASLADREEGWQGTGFSAAVGDGATRLTSGNNSIANSMPFRGLLHARRDYRLGGRNASSWTASTFLPARAEGWCVWENAWRVMSLAPECEKICGVPIRMDRAGFSESRNQGVEAGARRAILAPLEQPFLLKPQLPSVTSLPKEVLSG